MSVIGKQFFQRIQKHWLLESIEPSLSTTCIVIYVEDVKDTFYQIFDTVQNPKHGFLDFLRESFNFLNISILYICTHKTMIFSN